MPTDEEVEAAEQAGFRKLFRIALGALASIAADADTNAEAQVYAANCVRALTEAANKIGSLTAAERVRSLNAEQRGDG